MLRTVIDIVLVLAGLAALAIGIATYPDLHPLTLLALVVVAVALLVSVPSGRRFAARFEDTRR